jgi:hypothetical protein
MLALPHTPHAEVTGKARSASDDGSHSADGESTTFTTLKSCSPSVQ